MKRLKAIFTRPFPEALAALPGGHFLVAAFYFLAALAANASLVYSVATGKIPRKWQFEWLEARGSSPLLYWCYIAGLGVVVLSLDVFLVYGVWRHLRHEKKA